MFNTVGFPKAYDFRCDFSVMASRFYHAAKLANVECRSDYPTIEDSTTYFVYDYFFLPHEIWGKSLSNPPNQKNVNIICECFDLKSRAWNIRHISSSKNIAFNPVCQNYLLSYDHKQFYMTDLLSKFNDSCFVSQPLGTLHSLCKKEFVKRKVLILDEPHSITLCDLSKKEKQHVHSYLKSFEICKILRDRGWTIISFCTRDKDRKFSTIKSQFSFVDFIDFKSNWVPYLEMLEFYKAGTLFFNHYQETHGFSVYENLQMGNGVIVFEENFNPLSLNQFQNSCKLNLKMSSLLCANLIEEFYELLDPCKIARDSFERFSSDTFVYRLRSSMMNAHNKFPIF